MPRKPQRAKQLGVTDAEYERLLQAQGGGCAICGATPKTRRLHVDHDHKTGAVRGLLCHRCNRLLPAWVDRDWLLGAAAYLDPEGFGGALLLSARLQAPHERFAAGIRAQRGEWLQAVDP